MEDSYNIITPRGQGHDHIHSFDKAVQRRQVLKVHSEHESFEARAPGGHPRALNDQNLPNEALQIDVGCNLSIK